MTRDEYADGLLRTLWQHYDHGGISGRVLKAQLLETILPRRCGVPEIAINFDTLADARTHAEGVELSEQFLLFEDAHLLPDHEHRCTVICAIDMLSRAEEDPSLIEWIALDSLAALYSLDTAGNSHRLRARHADPWELLSASWQRAWFWDSEYGLLDYG